MKKMGLLVLWLFCLIGCSSIESGTGIVIEETGTAQIAQEQATPSAVITQEKQKPMDVPVEYLAKKNAADPFSDIIFAIDSAENEPPRFGVIYANLPDDAIVKIWLRYQDQNNQMQGKMLYEPVKKGIVKYLYDLPADLPEQTMLLEASLQMDDAAHPQPNSLVVLLGSHGEHLKGTQAIQRPDGNYYIKGEWALGWPTPQIETTRVYVSATGAKYHGQGCRHYRATMKGVPTEVAIMQGYSPCAVCGGK